MRSETHTPDEPSDTHRLDRNIVFRQRERLRLVESANWMLLGGLTLLLLSVCGAVSLVSDVLFGPGVAAITTAGVAAFYVLFWYVLPIVTRIRASR